MPNLFLPRFSSFSNQQKRGKKSCAAPLHVGMPWVWEQFNWGVLGRQMLGLTETPVVGGFRNAGREGKASGIQKSLEEGGGYKIVRRVGRGRGPERGCCFLCRRATSTGLGLANNRTELSIVFVFFTIRPKVPSPSSVNWH